MYENLVLEGGGFKGLAYIGAVRALETQKILSTINRFAGSSVGALVAACLSLGFTSQELENAVEQHGRAIDQWIEMPSSLEIILRIYSTGGVFEIEVMRKLVSQIVAQKIDPTVNLRQHHELTGKDLVLVSTDLLNGEYLFFYYQQYPDTLLVDAVVASMAIPFVFTPFHCGTWVADAGLFTNNYPVWLFNDLHQLTTGKFVRSTTVSPTTLGIRLLTTEELSHDQPKKSVIESLSDYVLALWKTLGILSGQFENIVSSSILIECNLPTLAFPANWKSVVQAGEKTTHEQLNAFFNQ